MLSNPYQQYRTTSVETSRPVDLVVMLYKGIIRFTQRGIRAVENQDIGEAHNSFVRAQDIVTELANGLNMELGGSVATQLAAIYEYLNRLLVDANCHKAIAPAAEVIKLTSELLTSWQAIADGRVDEALAEASRTEAPA